MKSLNYYHKCEKVNIKKDVKWKYQQLKNHLNQEVLDIGCGDGKFLSLSKKWQGIDNDPQSKYLNKDRNFKIGSILEIPYEDNSFDGVIISHVLEHIERDKTYKAIEEVSRILKAKGFVMIYSPNPVSTYWYDAVDHINPVNLNCLKEIFDYYGFKSLDMGYSLFRYFPYMIQRLLFLFFPYLPSEFYIKFVKR